MHLDRRVCVCQDESVMARQQERRNQLWAKRDRLGLPRSKVASELDPPVSEKTLERWEHGNRYPLWRRRQLEALYRSYSQAAA